MKTRSCRFISTFLAAGLCSVASLAHGAQLSLNFAAEKQGGLPTANYTSTALGTTVTSWDHVGQIDWSGGDPGQGIPPTFIESETGATISYYYDANNTWENPAVAQDSPLRGYLDDALDNQPFVQLGGLSNWLAAAGGTHWRLTVLRSTDNGLGFRDLRIRTGAVDGTWFRDTLPAGSDIDAIPGRAFPGGGPITMETEVYYGNSDGLAVHDVVPNYGPGGYRGTIAGLILESGAGPVTQLRQSTISANMQGRNPGYALAAGDVAGVVPASNWNNIENGTMVQGSFGPFPLKDTTGAHIADLQWSGTGTWGRTSIGGADGNMMAGHIEATDAGSTSVTVEGLADDYASYDVYVYVGDDAGGRIGEIRFNGGSPQTFTSKNFDGTYTVGTDYFLFSDVTGDSFTVSVEPLGDLGANRTGIRGIQVVGVPEPSSFVLAALAVAALGLAKARRRS